MFTGSIVAIVTPMDEKGNVCRASLKKLIDYHVASGTSAIVSVGTTGESATLNHDEHADVVMMTLDLADGRIPVIAGTGANATAEAISLTQRFNDSGIVGCLTVTPYYNRPSQEGLYQHFKAIAEHTDLPQILYNVPSRTGCDLLPETVGRLAKVKNIIGIKEATGNLTRIREFANSISLHACRSTLEDPYPLAFLGGTVSSNTLRKAASASDKFIKKASSSLSPENSSSSTTNSNFSLLIFLPSFS